MIRIDKDVSLYDSVPTPLIRPPLGVKALVTYNINIHIIDLWVRQISISGYRPRSEGDNALGSVRPPVRLSVLSRLNRLTYDLDFWHGGRP